MISKLSINVLLISFIRFLPHNPAIQTAWHCKMLESKDLFQGLAKQNFFEGLHYVSYPFVILHEDA